MSFFEFQKKIRVKLMPSGDKLAKTAQQKCGFKSSQIESDFNNCLKALLETEFKLYEQKEKECSEKIIREAERLKLLKKTSSLASSFKHNYQNIRGFFRSISQSRMSRAGGSFENHVRYLFESLKYPFNTQTMLNGKVDYVIPSEKAFRKNRTACVVISIKRTLRERWKQVVGELVSTNAGRIYIMTADTNISPSKIDEMKKHNVNLVVWDELKRKQFGKYYNVTGFSQFMKIDLPSSRKMWEQLL
ncbi:MAG: type II restriction endonuclease [Candidatus Ratteibacteria bacterium]|nr:type II restriction endonuclease [Candidatus Ratteibacteria bacterium]